METKAFPSFTLKIDGDSREVTGIAAVIGVIDAGNDLIHKGAFKRTIKQRAERVKHLWQHDNRQPPIAAIKELREVGADELPEGMKKKYPDAKGGLLVTRTYLETDRGNEVIAGLKSDPPAITEMSFGYDPVKYDFETVETSEGEVLLRNLYELRLWDTSDVNWGMNEATVASVKSAIPYKDTGVAPLEVKWPKLALGAFTDSDWEDLSDAEKKRIAAHFAWSATVPAESFGDLLLAHHQASKDGVGPVVWVGLQAAMGKLVGAAGEISSEARLAVYTHLGKHFEQFEKDPPKLKTVELAWSIGDALHKAEAAEAPELIQSLQGLQKQLRLDPLPDQEALTLRLSQEKLLRQKARLSRLIPN